MRRVRWTRLARAAAVIGVLGSIAGVGNASADAPDSFGDARILAQVPNPPGFPEGIAVRGNRVYVAGPATFGTTGKPPSAVLAFDLDTGALLQRYEVIGENLLAEHANSSIAFDGAGRLYVLNTQLGLYRLDVGTGAQEPYSSPFLDLKPCSPVAPAPCSLTTADAPPIPNDVAFDAAGNAYVTDSMQATIWKVPAGGGAPQVWFQDARLASPYIGVNGVRLDPTGSKAYLTVTTDLNAQSYVYRLPVNQAPVAADLETFHTYAPGDMPDGIAFGQSGLLYVAMATPGRSGVSALRQDGSEAFRLGNPAGSPVAPYDSPANIAFDGHGSLVMTNHAFASGAVLASQFSIVQVFVSDRAGTMQKPKLPL
jgi:sugar lactone lactonase YvrE